MATPDVSRRAPSAVAAFLSLSVILVCLAGTLALAYATKYPCAASSWSDGRQYRLFCYSDIEPLLETERLAGGRLPFLDRCSPPNADQLCDEYPVLTMYLMRVAGWMNSGSTAGFLYANELLLGLSAVAIAVFLFLLVGSRALYFVLAPTLVVYAFMNWDVFAAALATGALWALLSRRNALAGLLLGLGAAAKLYPALFVVPFAAHRLKERDPDGSIALVWAAAGGWIAVNAPFAILAPTSWWTFFRFNAARLPDWDSVYFIACRHLGPACLGADVGRVGVVNAISIASFAVSVGAVWWMKRRRHPDFQRFTLAFPILVLFLLTSKVYSPQYSIWLLPLFAVCLPDLPLFLLFSAADIAVFLTRFRFFAELDGRLWGWPQWWFETAVAARAAVLLFCLIRWHMREPEPLPGEIDLAASKPGGIEPTGAMA